MNKQQLFSVIRQRNFTLSDADVDCAAIMALDDITKGRYNFANYNKEVFTQQGKKRVIYSYDLLSNEDILCHYLKKKMDRAFGIKYASRNRIINILFNILPAIKDMNDFIVIRVDFKSFFDSVYSEHVYENYIKESMLRRGDKEFLDEYTKTFKYCYAGLCLSNGMTEIVCRDFDERIKAKFSTYGVFFYERYVDDILIITNKYFSKDLFLKIFDETIKEVFGKSPVKLNTSADKFAFISKRDLVKESNDKANKYVSKKNFNFLGYRFEMQLKKDKKLTFQYGIADKKIKRYKGLIERAFIDYNINHNEELLRQRIKIFSSRVVIAKTIGSSNYDWLTKGVVANYNELRYHMDSLLPDTKRFLRNIYFDLFKKYGYTFPYYLKQSFKEPSIYNIYSNMERNRAIVFEKSIGVSEDTLIEWITKIDPTYSAFGKDYYRIVLEYLDMIKVR